MSNHKIINLIPTLIIAVWFCSCSDGDRSIIPFQGEDQAVDMACKMFESIGGQEKWCEMQSLYVKANHTQPDLRLPYTSQIWRSMNTFELIIEQENDSFHVKGVFTEGEGIIHYLDQRDTTRILTDEQLQIWKHDHEHNVYVVLHKIACDPESYTVAIDEQQRLNFQKDTVLVTAFGLDDQFRPYLFYQPNTDGTLSGSIFKEWGTDHGLTHSAGGHPMDSSFFYSTEKWEPSVESLEASFGEEIFFGK